MTPAIRCRNRFSVLVAVLLVMAFFLSVSALAKENQEFKDPSEINSTEHQEYYLAGSGTGRCSVTIDSVPDHSVGDAFSLHGLADLPAGETVLIQIQSAITHPGIMIEGNIRNGMSSTAIVRRGENSRMEWTWTVNMTSWMPGPYDVFVTPVDSRYNGSAVTRFNLSGLQIHTPDIPADYISGSNTPGSTVKSSSIPGTISFLAIGCVLLSFCLTKRS